MRRYRNESSRRARLPPNIPQESDEMTTIPESFTLAGDGSSNARMRRGVYNFLDFKIAGIGPDETGVTPCNAHLQLALDTIPNYSDLYIPLPSDPSGPSGFFKLDLDNLDKPGPILCYDDAEHLNKRGIRIIGEGTTLDVRDTVSRVQAQA
jgi:hypothetical protein